MSITKCRAVRRIAHFKNLFAFAFDSRLIGMKDEQHRFMSILGQLPARLTAEQAGWVMNCQPHDIPALVAARLIKPLGNPAQNAIKFFATSELLERLQDRSWLAKVTVTISEHWQKQNRAKYSNRSVPVGGIQFNNRHEK